jgi:hypothetical protein
MPPGHRLPVATLPSLGVGRTYVGMRAVQLATSITTPFLRMERKVGNRLTRDGRTAVQLIMISDENMLN